MPTGRLDARAPRGGVDRRLPAPARGRAGLHVVLAERGQRLPDRPGVPERRAAATPGALPLRLGPPRPPRRERPRRDAPRPHRLTSRSLLPRELPAVREGVSCEATPEGRTRGVLPVRRACGRGRQRSSWALIEPPAS